jgi:CRISPR system Cascade subunit CasE
MFLHRIHLNPQCSEVRRDVADPYQLHSTLCRAFSGPSAKCPEGEFLWRLEPEIAPLGYPRILIQGKTIADWGAINVHGWLAKADPAIDLWERLRLELLKVGQRFRFRLRANPCVTRDGKRLGLLRRQDQEAWLQRKGQLHGFALPQPASFDQLESLQECIDVRITQEQMLRGRQRTGSGIRIYSVLYDGFLSVTEPEKLREALRTGIGHGKAMGLGLLSVAPVR